MKKLKAAKVQRPNERPQSATDRRYLAREAARYIRRADDLFRAVAEDAEASDAQRRWAIKEAQRCWGMAGLLIGDSRRGKMLQLVADAWDGKLKVYREGDYDEDVKAAWNSVVLPRGGSGRLNLNTDYSFEDIYKAFASKWRLRPVKSRMPTPYSLHRTLKRLRYSGPPPKRGCGPKK